MQAERAHRHTDSSQQVSRGVNRRAKHWSSEAKNSINKAGWFFFSVCGIVACREGIEHTARHHRTQHVLAGNSFSVFENARR